MGISSSEASRYLDDLAPLISLCCSRYDIYHQPIFMRCKAMNRQASLSVCLVVAAERDDTGDPESMHGVSS